MAVTIWRIQYGDFYLNINVGYRKQNWIKMVQFVCVNLE